MFFPENETSRMQWVRGIAQTISLLTQQTTYVPDCAATHTVNMISGNQVPIRKAIDVPEVFRLCREMYCSYDRKSIMYKFGSKGLNQRTLEEYG